LARPHSFPGPTLIYPDSPQKLPQEFFNNQ
jgi:hypothetical protein